MYLALCCAMQPEPDTPHACLSYAPQQMAQIQQVTELFQKLTTGASAEERAAPVAEVVSLVKSAGPAALASAGVVEKIQAAMEDAASPNAREGALQVRAAWEQEICACTHGNRSACMGAGDLNLWRESSRPELGGHVQQACELEQNACARQPCTTLLLLTQPHPPCDFPCRPSRRSWSPRACLPSRT